MLSLTALFLNLAAAAVAAAALFRLFFPLVTAVECAAAGVPVGLVLSAWTVLLLKSLLLTASVLSSLPSASHNPPPSFLTLPLSLSLSLSVQAWAVV